jgi:hypothetical protein
VPSLKRLRAVERGMTVKQIVMLHIQEGKRYPDIMSHAASLVGRSFAPEKTLCGRIEASVMAAVKDRPRSVRNELIREAQRNGLFLARLAAECNLRVAQTDRERTLESAVLHAFRLLCLRDEDEGAGDLLDMAEAVHRRAADLLEAVRLIERDYFDGMGILYEGAKAALVTQIGEAREFVHWARSHSGRPGVADTRAIWQPAETTIGTSFGVALDCPVPGRRGQGARIARPRRGRRGRTGHRRALVCGSRADADDWRLITPRIHCVSLKRACVKRVMVKSQCGCSPGPRSRGRAVALA